MYPTNILKDKEILEDITGGIIRGSAYPFSRYNEKVLNALKACGVSYARCGDESEKFDLPSDYLQLKPTVRHRNPKLFEIARRFLEMEIRTYIPPMMLYVMGHSYEFDNDNDWDMLEDFCKLIGGNKDIWYATNIEIYDYIQAYNSIRFNLAGTIAENPTATDVWICKGGKDYKLSAGKITRI